MDESYSSTPGIPSGSRILSREGVLYIADNFNISRTSVQLSRKGSKGQSNGFKLLPDRPSATAALQLETEDTPVPKIGWEFPPEATDDVPAWVVVDVGEAYVSDGLKTCSVTLWAKK